MIARNFAAARVKPAQLKPRDIALLCESSEPRRELERHTRRVDLRGGGAEIDALRDTRLTGISAEEEVAPTLHWSRRFAGGKVFLRAVRKRGHRAPVLPSGNTSIAFNIGCCRSEFGITIHHEIVSEQFLRPDISGETNRVRVEVPRSINGDSKVCERCRHYIALVHCGAQRAFRCAVARDDEGDLAMLLNIAPMIEIDRSAVIAGQDHQPVFAVEVCPRLDGRHHAANQHIGCFDRRAISWNCAMKSEGMTDFVDISYIKEGEIDSVVLTQRRHTSFGLRRVVLRILKRKAYIDRIVRQDALANRPPVAEVRGADRWSRALGQCEDGRKALVIGDEKSIVDRTVLVWPHAAENRRPTWP